MTQMPDLKIKGRLVFRPNEGDTEHDLGEVEFGPVQPIVTPYAKRQTFATGGVIPAQTILDGATVRRVTEAQHRPTADGMTAAMYNGQ